MKSIIEGLPHVFLFVIIYTILGYRNEIPRGIVAPYLILAIILFIVGIILYRKNYYSGFSKKNLVLIYVSYIIFITTFIFISVMEEEQGFDGFMIALLRAMFLVILLRFITYIKRIMIFLTKLPIKITKKIYKRIEKVRKES